MIGFAPISGAPASLNLRKLSFVSWYGDLIGLNESYDKTTRSLTFGYLYESDDSTVSVAAAVLEEHDEFPFETRSMIWRIAEIKVERQNEWLIFSRQQGNLSPGALADFLVDARNFLEHLRDEYKRLNPA